MADAADRSAEMTIDELAQHAGLPTSTVRLYQNRGLLPRPERRGRVGYYGAAHRERLRLIADLQERGFSLAAIKEALDSWTAGRSLGHLLGVGNLAPTLLRQPLRLTISELADRFGGVHLTQADVRRAAEIGLIEVDGTDLIVVNEAFADIGPAVARLGVPVTDILDEYEALASAISDIADRFRAVFDRNVWRPYVERGMSPDEIPSLTATVEELTALATATVTAELHRRFAGFASDYIARATARIEPGPIDA